MSNHRTLLSIFMCLAFAPIIFGQSRESTLRPLISTDDPVTDPDVINAQVKPKQPQAPLDGPPFVTCKAWAIGDARTGKLLWGHQHERLLHPASTTKIMTGLLVTSLAEQDPSVLEEIVTFSQRADNTEGSTAGLNAGEQVSVGELLYGLLLPSGNDASVALAEHFGGRPLRAEDGNDQQPEADASARFTAFVEAMNHRAREIGMRETTYKNTHGLTEEGHWTCARDLFTLAYHAMQQPEFSRRTSTVQRGCRVKTEAGYERNVVWYNTNRLLGTEGFDGVKTGTTKAAGCCLVSRGERDGQALIVVILGSASTDSRYADTQNLYRWAWQQLADASN